MTSAPQDDEWKSWFRENGARLLLVARLWSRGESEAEDILQEAFVRYWKYQRQLEGNAMALLVTSIKRVALDRQRSEERRRRRETESAFVVDERCSWFEQVPGAGERQGNLETALRSLPQEQREVLVLRIWADLGFAEIAEQLGIPPNTAASRFRYGLQSLRRLLGAAEQLANSRFPEKAARIATNCIQEG